MPTQKPLNLRGSFRRLAGELSPMRGWVGLGALLTVLAVTLQSFGPRILGWATDLVFAGFIGARLPAGASKDQVVANLRANGQDTFANMVASMDVVPGQGVDLTALGRLLMVALGLYLLAAALSWSAGLVFNRVTVLTMRRLRAQVEDKLHRLPLGYFDQNARGELLSRVTNDIDNLGMSLQQTFGQMFTSLVTVIAILVLMVSVSPVLTLVALVAIPVSIAATKAVAARSQPHFIRQWDRTGALGGQIEEAFTGHALVSVFGRRDAVLAEVERTNHDLKEASFEAQFVSGTIMPLTMFIGNLSYVSVALVGGLRVTSGAMTLGDVQAFIQYSRQFTQPMAQMASMANLLQSAVASAERVFELLDAPEQQPDPTQPAALAAGRGRIVFEQVCFRYEPNAPVIEDLSLLAQPGHTVAIVGPTGAGKTTLVNLIMRFYDLDSGRILLDDVDITRLTRHDLRRRIGMVLQDTWLFNGTIRDNIGYGRPGASDAEIHAAATATYVDRFVQHLPDGYDTVIDDEGSNISAGEKQLITIARAFLSDPSLLILDEATSSVDTRTELLLQHAMAALRSDRTSFVIAHRLSTIREADLILVMKSGRIVEQGTHEELLAKGGAYHQLHQAQFRAPTGSASD